MLKFMAGLLIITIMVLLGVLGLMMFFDVPFRG